MQGFRERETDDETTPSDPRCRWPCSPPAVVARLAAGAATGVSPARGFVPRQVVVKFEGQRRGQHRRAAGRGRRARAAAALRQQPGRRLRGAQLHRHGLGDSRCSKPGSPTTPAPLVEAPRARPAAGSRKQWNFLPWEGTGTRVAARLRPAASTRSAPGKTWQRPAGPGPKAITVAVLDTGIAYRDYGSRFRRSPDFAAGQFAKGYDFVDHDRLPLDENGHGTHVAGTIAEKTNNGIGLTGLAYRAKLMPVRVLDRHGRGRGRRHRPGHPLRRRPRRRRDQHELQLRLRQEGAGRRRGAAPRLRRGVVTVASVGNLGSEACVSPPATGPRVIGVGGTTEGGCLGNYSLLPGKGVDVLAPGGGVPISGCPSVSIGRSTR